MRETNLTRAAGATRPTATPARHSCGRDAFPAVSSSVLFRAQRQAEDVGSLIE